MSGRLLARTVVVGAACLAACGERMTQPDGSPVSPRAASRDLDSRADRVVGAVFVASNATTGNRVVAFARHADGSLDDVGTFATGGTGAGGAVDPLQSQGSLILSGDRQRLYVVNAGSNSISAFAVGNDASLRLLGTVGSGGSEPISLTIADGRLYALNADNTVAGFALDGNNVPRPISAATATLGSAADGPSTINASHDGQFLFVTERAANTIVVVSANGGQGLSVVNAEASSGGTPFGFAVTTRNELIVSEASGDAPNGAASSYTEHGGTLTAATHSASTHQAAACWLVLSGDERFAYVANAGSGSISGYGVQHDGTLVALDANGRTGVTTAANATPLDMATSDDGRFLYVLETGVGKVGAFAIGADGRLANLSDTPGLQAVAGFQGIAAY